MNALLSQLFPLLYGACFLALLWQAFKVMGQGFKAIPRPGDQGAAGSGLTGQPQVQPSSDRTGRLTIHPELLDGNGQLTQEDLLTVRFGGEAEPPRVSGEPTE